MTPVSAMWTKVVKLFRDNPEVHLLVCVKLLRLQNVYENISQMETRVLFLRSLLPLQKKEKENQMPLRHYFGAQIKILTLVTYIAALLPRKLLAANPNWRAAQKTRTSRMAHLKKITPKKYFKFIIRNPSQSSPILTILVPFPLIVTSLLLPYLSKLLFCGFDFPSI